MKNRKEVEAKITELEKEIKFLSGKQADEKRQVKPDEKLIELLGRRLTSTGGTLDALKWCIRE